MEPETNNIIKMARKRIKTLANDWGLPVEEVLASCGRLRLPHANSESSLLSQEETDRVKADLDDQAHREVLMRRETVVETSAGKVLEKRLNANVMRRRAAEPEPGTMPATEEPFHFELERAQDEPFGAPLFEPVETGTPELPVFEPIEPPASAVVSAAEPVTSSAPIQAAAAEVVPEIPAHIHIDEAPAFAPASELPVVETPMPSSEVSEGASADHYEGSANGEAKLAKNEGADVVPAREIVAIANGTAHASDLAPCSSTTEARYTPVSPTAATETAATAAKSPPRPSVSPQRQPHRGPIPPRPAASPMIQPPRDSAPTRVLGPSVGYRGVPSGQPRRPGSTSAGTARSGKDDQFDRRRACVSPIAR